MPWLTATNTTGETGRNVPVPRSRMTYGGRIADARFSASQTASSSSWSTSVGGISVTWLGTVSAIGSPNSARFSRSSDP